MSHQVVLRRDSKANCMNPSRSRRRFRRLNRTRLRRCRCPRFGQGIGMREGTADSDAGNVLIEIRK